MNHRVIDYDVAGTGGMTVVGPELSEGGAPYSYKIFSKTDEILAEIKFQNGAPDEHGCTIE